MHQQQTLNYTQNQAQAQVPGQEQMVEGSLHNQMQGVAMPPQQRFGPAMNMESSSRTMQMPPPTNSYGRGPGPGPGPGNSHTGMPSGTPPAPRMMPGSQSLLPPGKFTPSTKSVNSTESEESNSNLDPMDEFVY
ncbi:MAG: hypothetical protein KAJ51_03635, partial [Thermoplasmata archaeon]|nr:hypothetical protein [Thermoplasmata archaeon]